MGPLLSLRTNKATARPRMSRRSKESGFVSLLCQPDTPPMSIRLRLSCGLSEQATPLIKIRLLRQRACNEKNEKGKICAGHLKRWFTIQEGWINRFGPNAELYRCEKCKTIYLPNPEEAPRTATLAW